MMTKEVIPMSYDNIQVETRGRVGVIRLDRPQALNALNSALNAELAQAVAAFDADAGVGCILLTGSDKAFAAGADIKEMADKTAVAMFMGDFGANWEPVANLMEEAMKVAEAIASMSLPAVLAAKEAINRAFEGPLAEGLRFERRLFHSLFATHDQKEGMAAFVEKRKPKFENK